MKKLLLTTALMLAATLASAKEAMVKEVTDYDVKKLFAIALLALTTACAQIGTSSMESGMTCEKCPCCQKMMEGGMKMDGMKDGMMKSGMQCPMMQGKSKDGMKCGCCQGMMDSEIKKSMPRTW